MPKNLDFMPSTSQPDHDTGEVTAATVASQLSGPLTAIVGSAFVSGAMYGLLEFLQRSPVSNSTSPGPPRGASTGRWRSPPS
jgi:hypothetical protein